MDSACTGLGSIASESIGLDNENDFPSRPDDQSSEVMLNYERHSNFMASKNVAGFFL